MERYRGKVAIVTGASSGIGATTALALAEEGMKVVALARRVERIEALAKQVAGKTGGKLYPLKADLTKEEDILAAFEWTKDNVGPVHVLINNAGLIPKTDLVDGDTQCWKSALDTNVLALAITSREAIKIMRDNSIDGHIVNINSVWGHIILSIPGRNIYPASKHAVTALTETLRLELIRLGSKIKVTSLSPGTVDTELLVANNLLGTSPIGTLKKLESKDITDAILYVLGTPSHVQVTELIIRPVGEGN